MNCTQCRENLIAYVEGLLEERQRLECESHLDACPACRAERDAVSALQRRLIASGKARKTASMGQAVMNRILTVQSRTYGRKIMIRSITRWGMGVGGVAAAAAVVVAMLFWATPNGQAKAGEVLAKGAQAASNLTGIHIKARLRTLPADNFAHISAEGELVPIEIWKEFSGNHRWRINKPGRMIVMDGQSTTMLIEPSRVAVKVPRPTQGSFDTGWLHEFANIGMSMSNALTSALADKWDLRLTHEKGPDGRPQQVVTVEARSGLPEGDYVKNKFFMDADTRRVYRFDAQSGRLEDIKVYLHAQGGDVLIFEVQQLEYNPTIDPSVFTLELPEDVVWYKEPEKLPDNEKYSKMTPEQAARAFFEACAKEDWEEARNFYGPLNESTKKNLGGLEIIKIAESFGSAGYSGRYVPYEIKLRDGSAKKHNLALRNDNAARRYVVVGFTARRA